MQISLTGIHADGALQERLVVASSHVFPVGDLGPALTALVEPVSIAVRAVARGRVEPAEHVVILGAGPIGQALALAATDRGASALLVDRIESRLAHGGAVGADTLHVAPGDDLAAAVREWSGGDGPEVVFEATGVPDLVQTAVELVAPAGRVVVVGLSSEHAPVRVGDLPVQGDRSDRDELLRLETTSPEPSISSRRRRDAVAGLVTHEFTLEQAPEAMAYAIEHPAEVMKAVVRLDGP